LELERVTPAGDECCTMIMILPDLTCVDNAAGLEYDTDDREQKEEDLQPILPSREINNTDYVEPGLAFCPPQVMCVDDDITTIDDTAESNAPSFNDNILEVEIIPEEEEEGQRQYQQIEEEKEEK
jgi:hypothetical protein